MKNFSLLRSIFVSAILMAGATACVHHPYGPTPIPGGSQSAPTAPGPGDLTLPAPPPGGNTLPATPPVQPGQNIAESDAGSSGVWSGVIANHDEDADKFKSDTVHFDYDSATIRKSEDKKLEAVAAYFKNNTTDALRVEGNCDERGTEKYNLALGERRAQVVREYLATLGVDPLRIVTITYGSSKPADPGHSESAWKKNRRSDFILLTPKK